MLIFIHIPKTGGTSFKAALKARLPNHYLHGETKPYPDLEASKPTLHEYDLVGGHLYISDLSDIPGEKRFVTVVREPVSRLFSFWRYVARREAHSLHGFTKAGPEAFFRTCRDIVHHGHRARAIAINAGEAVDGMCFRLSGERSAAAAMRAVLDNDVTVLRQASLEDDARRLMGWPDFSLPALNIVPTAEECPAHLGRLIADMNREDLRLFDALARRAAPAAPWPG